MGWGNPAVSWSEMERILAGKPARSGAVPSREGAPEVDGPGTLHPADVGTVPVREDGRRSRPSRDVPHPGDGGDSPAWSRTRAPYRPPSDTVAGSATPTTVPFAELHTHSTYSFLDGASQPEELVEEAHRLGLEAIALTDHDGMYGVVRFAEAARELGVRTVFGAELSLGLSAPQNGTADPEGEHLLVLARDPAGYRAISRAITAAAMDPEAEKGRPVHDLERTAATLRGQVTVLTGCRKGHVRRALDAGGPDAAARALDRLVGCSGRSRSPSS
jgi:error-prone DNA polymerase